VGQRQWFEGLITSPRDWGLFEEKEAVGRINESEITLVFAIFIEFTGFLAA
jgi:hypothetical protein